MAGLRYKDIKQIKPGKFVLDFIQEKTGRQVMVPLAAGALEITGIPARENMGDTIFDGLSYSSHSLVILQRWVHDAGIYKKVTWHTARHSFGQILFEKTGNIYAVASLMGDTLETVIRNYVKKVKTDTKIDAIDQLDF